MTCCSVIVIVADDYKMDWAISCVVDLIIHQTKFSVQVVFC